MDIVEVSGIHQNVFIGEGFFYFDYYVPDLPVRIFYYIIENLAKYRVKGLDHTPGDALGSPEIAIAHVVL